MLGGFVLEYTMKKAKAKTPDAAESNAGDDFHILWAIRKSLDLLNFKDDGLKAVTIEGLTKPDEKIIDNDGDALLGVDLTEYYGGEGFKDAAKIIVSQLKYSTRRPNLEWTTAKICTGKKGDEQGSLIYRLAGFFRKLDEKKISGIDLNKLQIKLISNRPAAKELVDCIANIKIALNNGAKTIKTINNKLIAKDQKQLQRLKTASKLKDSVFISFLKVLDFSDCNTGSRFMQQQILITAIDKLGKQDSNTELAKLRQLITNKTMPESKGNTIIRKSDILLSFGMTDDRDLFPVKSRFEVVKNLVEREQIPDLITEINTTKAPIVIDAGAGMGKSTLVSSLPKFLPSESIYISYDCYGGGTYLDAGDERHTHENAFLQLSNELALKIGTSFLIDKSLKDAQYVKEFKKRLERANEIIKALNPNALVIIAIDAADNAITAANQKQSHCFVNDLVNLPFPDSCRLILTLRTERKTFIHSNDDLVSIAVKEFSLNETAILLKYQYPKAKETEISEFRALTKAIPRVMSYILDFPGKTLAEKLKLLKPHGKNLDDIFKLRISEAGKRAGNKAAVTNFLTYLILLPRPVPLMYIQEASGIASSLIEDLSVDLFHGLVYSNQQFSIRDEDFESFLRVTYVPTKTHIQKIASVFLAHAQDQEYASINLGAYLSRADEKDQLLEIVLDRKFLNYPQDPMRKKEVFVERAQLAMRLCIPEKSNLNFLKLQMIAAEAVKTNRVLENALINHAELAIWYGNLHTNRKLFFQDGNPRWYGKIHFKSAAVYSRKTETYELSKIHFNKAREWYAYRRKLSKAEKRDFEFTYKEIAYGAEAILRVEGLKEAIKWLNIWEPKHFAFSGCEELINNVFSNSDQKDIEKWIKNMRFRPDVSLLLVDAALRRGKKIKLDLKRISSVLQRQTQIKKELSKSLYPTLLSFCEYALANGLTFDDVDPLLNLINVSIPDRLPNFISGHTYDNGKENLDILVRKLTILSCYKKIDLKIELFYSERLKKNLQNKDYKYKREAEEERDKINKIFRYVLPIYQLRFDCIEAKRNKKELTTAFEDIINAYDRDYDISYRFNYEFQYINHFLGLKLLEATFHTDIKNAVPKIKKSFAEGRNASTSLLLNIAQKISENSKFQEYTLDLLSELDTKIDSHNLPGSEQAGYYAEITKIAKKFTETAGKFYFDKLVECASEIDEEAYDQIRCFNTLLNSEKPINNPELAYNFARFVEYTKDKLSGYDHFPWEEAVNSLVYTDARSVLPTFCRWDDRKVLDISDHLNETLKAAIQQEIIDYRVAFSLLPLSPYRSGFDELLGVLIEKNKENKDKTFREAFIKELIAYIKSHYFSTGRLDILNQIKDQARTSNIDPSITQDLDLHLSILKKCLKNNTINKDEKKRVASKKSRNAYSKYTRKVKVINTQEIENLLINVKKENDGYGIESIVLGELRERIKLKDQMSFLDALITLNPDTISLYALKDNLEYAFSSWKSNPEITLWKTNKFHTILKNHFHHFFSYDQIYTSQLKELANLLDLDDLQLAKEVIAIIPDYLNEISDRQLFQLFQITKAGIPLKDRVALLEWILPIWSIKIKPAFGSGLFDKKISPPQDSNLLVARFIRYHLGHPDKRIRWRAAHCLRYLARFTKGEILNHLLIEQNETSCHQYQGSKYPFFWISAKLYLWIAIERVSKEAPDALEQFSDAILHELQYQDLPHTLIRYFAKSTCNILTKFKLDLYTEAQKKIISTSLISLPKKPKEKTTRSYLDKHPRDLNTKFSFDPTDTIPSWYSPLGSVFGVGARKVAELADNYISNVWGFTNENVKERRNDREWQLESHRHGSEPTIENTRTYLEYHAMFCAANDLLKADAPIEDDWNDDWNDWIRGEALCWEDRWLADFRDPIPLERFYQNLHREESRDWSWAIELDDFHKTIGLKDVINEDYLTAMLDTTTYYGKDHESRTVSSALVDPKLAKSLLVTLQTANKYEIYFPTDDDDEDDLDDEIESDFNMIGWLERKSSRDDGLDAKDEFFNDIAKYRIVPGQTFKKWSDCIVSDDYRYSYRADNPTEKLTVFTTWSNATKEKHYHSNTTEGSCLQIKKKELLKFLKNQKKSLVLRCNISRRKDRDDTEEYMRNFNDTYTLIYIIHSDGTIKTISGDHKLR